MMRKLDGRPELCAINTATLGFQSTLRETIEAVARHGFGGIAPWRREVEGQNVKAIARQIHDAKLAVTGYCRSTYFPATTREGFDANVAANRAALQDAALLGAQSFVMVVGGLPQGSKDIAFAREQVKEGVGLLAAAATELGVKIAIEPLHPVYAADRSCLTTIEEAVSMMEALQAPEVGVCLDVYHIWWDARLFERIAACRGRISGFHVSDWLVPTRDSLNDRGMMGDGVIDIPAIRAAIEAAGYDGLVEVEIFSSENWWKRPVDVILETAKERLFSCC